MTVALRSVQQSGDPGAVAAAASITAFTHRRPDGSDAQTTFFGPGDLTSTGALFDDALSSVTLGMVGVDTDLQCVMQILDF